MAAALGQVIRYRWRTLGAAAAGLLGAVAAGVVGAAPGAAAMIGWNLAAVLFLGPTLTILFRDDEATVRERAGREDESRAVIMIVILVSVAASLGAIVLALRESRVHPAHGTVQHPAWVLGVSVSTLVLSWLVVQTVFALHYAHRYFGDRDRDGSADEGVKFPGDPPTTYKDFVYVAVCIGATCQVSDFNITHARFRNLVTAHALVSFVFNTMVLALGINILGNLMGQ